MPVFVLLGFRAGTGVAASHSVRHRTTDLQLPVRHPQRRQLRDVRPRAGAEAECCAAGHGPHQAAVRQYQQRSAGGAEEVAAAGILGGVGGLCLRETGVGGMVYWEVLVVSV